MMDQERLDEFASQFAKYARYGTKFNKAVKVVMSSGVKKHRFFPSGRVIYTVVGTHADEFIDPERPYCSCSHFFFRVLGGGDELCYHLLSFKMALESKRVDTIDFADEEYSAFLTAVMKDVMKNQDVSGGKLP